MTEEERTRFALVLREAERVRAQIAKDESATRTEDGGDYSIPVVPIGDQSPVMVARHQVRRVA
jgi:hypothetical protein